MIVVEPLGKVAQFQVQAFDAFQPFANWTATPTADNGGAAEQTTIRKFTSGFRQNVGIMIR